MGAVLNGGKSQGGPVLSADGLKHCLRSLVMSAEGLRHCVRSLVLLADGLEHCVRSLKDPNPI